MFQISPFYYSHVCGLCGNFDGKQGNEFQSPSRTDRSDSSCLVLDYLVPDSKCDSQSIRKECQQPHTSSCKCSCGCWTSIEMQIQAFKWNERFVILNDSRKQLIELLIDWLLIHCFTSCQGSYFNVLRCSRSVLPANKSISLLVVFVAGCQLESKTIRRTRLHKGESQLCLSQEPVKSCPSQCKPVDPKSTPVRMACFPHDSAKAKELERDSFKRPLDLKAQQADYTEYVQVPRSCGEM